MRPKTEMMKHLNNHPEIVRNATEAEWQPQVLDNLQISALKSSTSGCMLSPFHF